MLFQKIENISGCHWKPYGTKLNFLNDLVLRKPHPANTWENYVSELKEKATYSSSCIPLY